MSEHTYIRRTLLDCGRERIELNSQEFIIDPQKQVGRGGTCLVYHACKKESPHIFRKVILKEFYPLTSDCGTWRQEDGTLIFPENNPEVVLKKSRFDRSRALFVELHNDETLNHSTAETQEYIHANGTVYMVVDYSSGKSLADYFAEGSHSLFDTVTLLRKLAEVLDLIHAKNYLHMDLKPDNVLCHGDGIRVIDTDSFLKIDELKSISSVDLSFSQGFAAPEVLVCARHPDNSSGWQLLSESGIRTDVYSFGAILYAYLFGQAPESGIRPRHRGPQIAAKLREKDPDIPKKAVLLIQTLLYGTLARLIDDRYDSMKTVIHHLDQILTLVKPREFQILARFFPNPYPVFGRELPLADLREKLMAQTTSGSRIVCVTGMGGVGKSTLARLYGETYQSEYDVITEVSAASAAEAVKGIPIRNWEPDEDLPEPEQIRKRVEKLASLTQDFRTLIIVNNYDVSEDLSLSIWEALHCDIILTSRHDWSLSGLASVHLSCACLPSAAAKEIFIHHYLLGASSEADRTRLLGKLQQDEQSLNHLLARLNYHPLGIRLTARYMAAVRGMEQLPGQVLQMLEQQGFQPESAEVIQADRDGGILEKNVYGHLRSIFRLSHFKPKEQSTLRYMLLTSPHQGISPGRFARWTREDPTLLDTLGKHGWLEYIPGQQDPLDTDAHQGIYQLPMILRQVLQKESSMACTCENCGPFLQSAADANVDHYTTYEQRRCLCEAQERLIALFHQEPSETCAKLLNITAVNLFNLNPYHTNVQAILDYSQKCMEMLFALQLPQHPLIADCATNMGILFRHIGQRQDAYDFFRYALDFEKKHKLLSPSDAAQLSLNISGLYWDIGNLNKAISLARQALKDLTPESGETTISALFALGFYLQKTGHLEEAEIHLTAAEDLCARLWDHGQTVGIKTNFVDILLQLGTLQLELDVPEQAMAYLLRALESAKVLYGEKTDSVIVNILQALADACIRLNAPDAAISHREAALDILKSNREAQNWSSAEHYVFSALDSKPLDTARLYRLAGDADPESTQWQLADCMLRLAVDYIHRDPLKPTQHAHSGIAAFNSALGSCRVSVDDIDKLYLLYYRQAIALFRKSLIPDGLFVLEAWAALCQRLYGSTMETATEYWCLSRIYHRLRVPKKAAHYRRLADSCGEWNLRKMGLQWLHTGHPPRYYQNSNSVYVCKFQDLGHFTEFSRLLKTIRRVKGHHRKQKIKAVFRRIFPSMSRR